MGVKLRRPVLLPKRGRTSGFVRAVAWRDPTGLWGCASAPCVPLPRPLEVRSGRGLEIITQSMMCDSARLSASGHHYILRHPFPSRKETGLRSGKQKTSAIQQGRVEPAFYTWNASWTRVPNTGYEIGAAPPRKELRTSLWQTNLLPQCHRSDSIHGNDSCIIVKCGPFKTHLKNQFK